MNPLTNVKNIIKLNEREIQLGINQKSSWHNQYKDSAWLFIGGLPFDLTEGDIICVFSQYGEIVNINLVRDKKTGKSRGFCFLCYENQQSTVLAVDNFNGIKLLGRTIRVDHVSNYKPPKEYEDDEEELKGLRNHGCAPKMPEKEEPPIQLDDLTISKNKHEKKKKKKDKKKKKHKKHSKHSSSDTTDSEESTEQQAKTKRRQQNSASPNSEENRQEDVVKVKTEKDSNSYEKYNSRDSFQRERSPIRNREGGWRPNRDSPAENRSSIGEHAFRQQCNRNLPDRNRPTAKEHDSRQQRDSPVRNRSHIPERDSRQNSNRNLSVRERSPIGDHESRQRNRDSQDVLLVKDRDSKWKHNRESPVHSPIIRALDDVVKRKYNRDTPPRDKSNGANSRFEDRRRNI